MQAQLGAARHDEGMGEQVYASGNAPLSGGGTPPQVPTEHHPEQQSALLVHGAPSGSQPGGWSWQ
jgi:hypothetical protein